MRWVKPGHRVYLLSMAAVREVPVGYSLLEFGNETDGMTQNGMWMDESNMQAELKEIVGDDAKVALGKLAPRDNPPCFDSNLARNLFGATHLWRIAADRECSNPLVRTAEVIGSILTAENLYSIPTAGNPLEHDPIGQEADIECHVQTVVVPTPILRSHRNTVNHCRNTLGKCFEFSWRGLPLRQRFELENRVLFQWNSLPLNCDTTIHRCCSNR